MLKKILIIIVIILVIILAAKFLSQRSIQKSSEEIKVEELETKLKEIEDSLDTSEIKNFNLEEGELNFEVIE